MAAMERRHSNVSDNSSTSAIAWVEECLQRSKRLKYIEIINFNPQNTKCELHSMQHSMEHDMFQYAADRCRFTTSRVGLLSPFGYSRRWPLGKAGAADSLRWTSCAPRLHIGVRNWFFPELPEGARAWHYLDFYVLELGLCIALWHYVVSYLLVLGPGSSWTSSC